MENRHLFHRLFSFQGRMARIPFGLAFAANISGWIFLGVLLDAFMPSFGRLPLWEFLSVWVLHIGLFVNALALISRRFHDTGRSFGVFFGLCLLGNGLGMAIGSFVLPQIGLLVGACFGIYILYILLQRTNTKDEKYGPVDVAAPAEKLVRAEETPVAPSAAGTAETVNGIPVSPADEEQWEKMAADMILPSDSNQDEMPKIFMANDR